MKTIADPPLPSAVESMGRMVVEAALRVHRELGPGLLESVYELCLFDELQRNGIDIRRQVSVPVTYRGKVLDGGFRADLVIGDAVLVELKCVETLQPIHEAQIMTYLRLSDLRLGFLINFNVPLIKTGIRRFVL